MNKFLLVLVLLVVEGKLSRNKLKRLRERIKEGDCFNHVAVKTEDDDVSIVCKVGYLVGYKVGYLNLKHT